MKKRHFFPISLILLNGGFSDEIETNHLLSDSSITLKTSTLSAKKTQKQLAEKRAELEHKEKELSEQEEELQAKEEKLAKQGQSLLDQQEEIAAQEEELAVKEEMLAEREIMDDLRESQLSLREQELTEEMQQSLSDAQTLSSDKQPTHPVRVAQNTDISPPNKPSYTPSSCSLFHRMHMGLRHTEAHGLGYEEGYTTLEVFGIYDGNSSSMPFLDIRGHVFDNGTFAGNVGVGGRSRFTHHLLGYYCYYDIKQDRHHLTAQQVSPGLELLGPRMEYRLNGYFPVGKDASHQYGFKFDSFDGHHILIKAKKRHVMTGGDAEVGVHLTQSLKYDAYLGAGPYYFTASHASAWGGKVRLLGRYKEYIALEASYTYDHLFGSIVQGTIALNLPFGPRLKKKNQACSSKANLVFARAAFSPYRFEIPVVKKVTRKEKAINPVTDDPWIVWFVDNTSSSDGTFESPFPTLVQAQNASLPNEMIYVFPGDGTTRGMDMGIILQDGQKFFGSGTKHKIHITKGKVTIPAFSKTLPSITTVSLAPPLPGAVIIPANGNEISGFNIIPFLFAISSPANVRGMNVNHNNISGPGPYFGIVLPSASGKVVITHNQLSGVGNAPAIGLSTAPGETLTGKISGNVITNSAGIQIHLMDNSIFDFKISNNTITQTVGIGGAIILQRFGNPSSSNVLISGNAISNFANIGIFVAGVAPNATTKIIGNTVNNNTGIFASNGIAFSISQGPNAGKVIVSNNKVFTSTASANVSGILVEIAPNPGTTFNAEINNNQVTIESGAGTAAVGINVRTAPNGVICTGISNNQVIVQAPGATGINVSTSGTGVINIDKFVGNVAAEVNFSGNVNQVTPGTCDP